MPAALPFLRIAQKKASSVATHEERPVPVVLLVHSHEYFFKAGTDCPPFHSPLYRDRGIGREALCGSEPSAPPKIDR